MNLQKPGSWLNYPKIDLPDIHGQEGGALFLVSLRFSQTWGFKSLFNSPSSPSDLKVTGALCSPSHPGLGFVSHLPFPTEVPHCLHVGIGLICYAVIQITVTSTMVLDSDLPPEQQVRMNPSCASPILITNSSVIFFFWTPGMAVVRARSFPLFCRIIPLFSVLWDFSLQNFLFVLYNYFCSKEVLNTCFMKPQYLSIS